MYGYFPGMVMYGYGWTDAERSAVGSKGTGRRFL